MSGKPLHDRVRFFLNARRVTSSRCKFAELLRFAFDMDICQFLANVHEDADKHCEGVEIICRPSQFARFIIKRNELGLNNGLKELSPELYVPCQSAGPYDVSKRTHKDPRMGHGHDYQDEV